MAKRHIIPLFVPHCGCPNDCVFCNQRRISGSLSPARASDVIQALKKAAEMFPEGGGELAFYGGSFTAIPMEEQTELLGAAAPFLSDGTIASIRVSTRPDAIDPEKLSVLRRYGVKTIELGAQSMLDEVLRLSGRGHTAEDTVTAAHMIKQAGFSLILQMMTGLPGDGEEGARETARRIIALKPDGVRIYPTVIIKNTQLEDMWLRGDYYEHTVQDAVDVCALLVPMFNEHGIPIIRLGLNPTDALSGGDAVAGAYHPAFGELVISEIMLRKARRLLKSEKHGDKLALLVNAKRVSAMAGQHRKNTETLKREFGLKELKIRAADTGLEEIAFAEV